MNQDKAKYLLKMSGFYLAVLLIAVIFILITGCSSLRIERSYGYMTPTVYKLTDGNITIRYANGDCCCIAEEVLEDVRDRVDCGEIIWSNMRNKDYADSVLSESCTRLKIEQLMKDGK